MDWEALIEDDGWITVWPELLAWPIRYPEVTQEYIEKLLVAPLSGYAPKVLAGSLCPLSVYKHGEDGSTFCLWCSSWVV